MELSSTGFKSGFYHVREQRTRKKPKVKNIAYLWEDFAGTNSKPFGKLIGATSEKQDLNQFFFISINLFTSNFGGQLKPSMKMLAFYTLMGTSCYGYQISHNKPKCYNLSQRLTSYYKALKNEEATKTTIILTTIRWGCIKGQKIYLFCALNPGITLARGNRSSKIVNYYVYNSSKLGKLWIGVFKMRDKFCVEQLHFKAIHYNLMVSLSSPKMWNTLLHFCQCEPNNFRDIIKKLQSEELNLDKSQRKQMIWVNIMNKLWTRTLSKNHTSHERPFVEGDEKGWTILYTFLKHKVSNAMRFYATISFQERKYVTEVFPMATQEKDLLRRKPSTFFKEILEILYFFLFLGQIFFFFKVKSFASCSKLQKSYKMIWVNNEVASFDSLNVKFKKY
ncbi:hypothetical protein EGR_01185 [Echinococcus granulosus]|uniref:Uncharacterized protein n=1 Tax=Echinococcus granulosus TaxID=6210 RepID=W6UZS7_ECHGR|nr:hypothetical protein EGR_01185 [Echinococcus granulosus]EUB64057.1 hypothetical protein EGR_01185 [Echinococcus granulosus]